jgi:hypothetical protein
MWSGLKSIHVYGKDAKAKAAIFHGISQLSPPPYIEMDAGEMTMIGFKALFRLKKGKLQPGTKLRLITKQPTDGRRSWGYVDWDEEAESYWTERAEEAAQIANKYDVRLEVSTISLGSI